MSDQQVIEAVETDLEQAAVLVKNNPVLLVGAAVVSLAAGAVGGYFFAKKRLTLKYEELSRQEIEEAKHFYRALRKEGEYETPEKAAANLIPNPSVQAASSALHVYQGGTETSGMPAIVTELKVEDEGLVEEIVEVETRNIFVDAAQQTPDLTESELGQRRSDIPYIITKDEFFENEPEFEQSTVTFYEGDDVLSDESEKPIEDSDSAVGDLNLHRFGHGSGDKNIVYIRNERISHDFEVVRSPGKFSVEVLGFDDPDERRGPVQRFRSGDDG